MKQHGFFDKNDRLKELSKLGDPLERPSTYIDWEQFRGIVSRTFRKEHKGPGGIANKRPVKFYEIFGTILVRYRTG